MGMIGVGRFFGLFCMAVSAVFRRNQGGDGRLVMFEGVDIPLVSLVAVDAADVIDAMGGIFPLLIKSGVFLLMTGYAVFSTR